MTRHSSRINWDLCRISLESWYRILKCVCVRVCISMNYTTTWKWWFGERTMERAHEQWICVCIVYGIRIVYLLLMCLCISCSVLWFDLVLWLAHSLSCVVLVWFQFLYWILGRLLLFFSPSFFSIYVIFWQRTNPIFNIAERVYMIDFVFCLYISYTMYVRCVTSFVLFVCCCYCVSSSVPPKYSSRMDK